MLQCPSDRHGVEGGPSEGKVAKVAPDIGDQVVAQDIDGFGRPGRERDDVQPRRAWRWLQAKEGKSTPVDIEDATGEYRRWSDRCLGGHLAILGESR